jgi:hypothetical protein
VHHVGAGLGGIAPPSFDIIVRKLYRRTAALLDRKD